MRGFPHNEQAVASENLSNHYFKDWRVPDHKLVAVSALLFRSRSRPAFPFHLAHAEPCTSSISSLYEANLKNSQAGHLFLL